MNARGHDAIDAAISANGDDPLVIGFDVASMGADGRLARVVGFLDKVPG